jgi:rhodanese-related sulfurtransferase
VRDHADEDADHGLTPDDVLRSTYDLTTPLGVPGARTVRTPDLPALLKERKPMVLDTMPWGDSIPGAIGLWGAGIGGSLSDEFQDRLQRKMQTLTTGDRSIPVVTVGWNAELHQGRNLALRLVALGYTEVYWYRGGREAWMAAGLPTAEVTPQDW